ncbi:GFA family protein [Microbulbifer sp. 2304DJ12-6]|uniref:GFA family protein n=1 Tax=Microbulbifer sp. 2304DJ12-6 TaxID=3233340 RepID=UPI0039B0943C
MQLFVCHCAECRKQSDSVFTNKEALCVPKGKPKFWCPTADSGNALECAFFPKGGIRLSQQRRGSTEIVSVKGGSLDNPIDIDKAIHIWIFRKLRGFHIAKGSTQFP